MKPAKIHNRGLMSTYLAIGAKLLMAISMACNPTPHLTDEAILIQNVSIIDPVNGLETQKSVVVDRAKTEAIKAATVEPAKFLGVEQQTSRILESYDADLLLLSENPLERISATKEIEVVIKAGKVISKEEL